MKNKRITKALVLFLFITSLLSVNAQPKNLQFRHLTRENGLSHSWVHSIIQDKYGFMWFGTDDGLNRYDSYNFRIYKNNLQDKNSISSNIIMAFYEDSRGDLWIGTRQGLNLFDRGKDCFIRHQKLLQHEILSIVEDKDRNLWIGATNYLFRLDLKNDSLYTYSPNIISHDRVFTSTTGGNKKVIIDNRNNVWIATSYGLFLYDKAKDTFIDYFHDDEDPYSINSNDLYSILEDKSGRLWIGTSKGLDLFINANEYPQKGIFIHYNNIVYNQRSISKGSVISLLEDTQNNLWIGIENGGLDLLRLDNFKAGENKFVHFKNEPGRANSLSNNSIYSLFQDIQGSIWIGTFGNGINFINITSHNFIHVKSEHGVKNSLNNNQVHAFCEDGNYLWIGTDRGLNRYNKKDGTYKYYIYDPLDDRSIGSDVVWSICKGKSGNLWIGTWGGGLNRFDYKTETFEHYYNDPSDTNSLGSNNMFSVFEDRDGDLWIGTMGSGLNMFNKKDKTFIKYKTSNSGIYTNFVQAIIEAKNGDLWMANVNAFCRFDKKNKVFEIFRNSQSDNASLRGSRTRTLLEDSNGNLWMGTNDGLNFYNKSNGRFTCYQVKDGLPDNSVNSIIEDKHGNLWIGTNKGLSRFKNAINLPEKPEFRNYTYEDGLQGNEFGKRTCYRSADWMLYFGGANGFNVFDPEKVTENTYVPPIVISDFQIFNKPELIGDKGLKKDRGNGEELTLSYTQTVFSFDYAALNYISSSKNQYAYKLEGFDNDWNYVGTKRSVTYTNLDPGRYVFRAKGSNNDGVWNEEGISLAIIIIPPFWRTAWFYGLILFITGGLVFGLYRWRVWQLLKHEKELNLRIQEALAKNRILGGLLPICSNCKKIRDDKGYWDQLERYIQTHSEAQFTHGICPDCAKKLYPSYNFDDDQ